MNKQDLLNTVRDLISEAEIDQALDLLEREWSGRRELKTLLREVLSIGALYNKTKSDEVKGIISFDNAQLNYNRVNDRLLSVLELWENDQLESEDLVVEQKESSGSRKKWLWTLLLVPVLGLLIFLLKPDPVGGEKRSQRAPQPCPTFDQASLKIMVLPFYKVNRSAGQPEGLFVEKLEAFCATCKLNVSVKINENFQPLKLLNYEEAGRLAKSCNADLIFWGRIEFASGRNILKTRYRYTEDRERPLELSKLKWGENQFDTVRVLSDIASDRTFTADLEEVVLLALGATEMMEGRPDKAACLLSSFKTEDSLLLSLRSLMLAENFIQMGKPQQALRVYDELLTAAPANWLALNNRGMILMKENNYLQAIKDFSDAVQIKEDPEVLYARAKAYQLSDQLTKAEDDFKKVVGRYPELAPKAKTDLEATRREIRKQERIIREFQPQPGNNLNSNTYFSQVDAYSRLGENQKAIQLVEKGLEVKPLDPKLTAKKIELLLKNDEPEAAKEALRAARNKGLSYEELSRHSDTVAQFIKELKARHKLRPVVKNIN